MCEIDLAINSLPDGDSSYVRVRADRLNALLTTEQKFITQNSSALGTTLFTLTPKEELAVINERLKTHCADCQDIRSKTLLNIASDCVRSAIFRR